MDETRRFLKGGGWMSSKCALLRFRGRVDVDLDASAGIDKDSEMDSAAVSWRGVEDGEAEAMGSADTDADSETELMPSKLSVLICRSSVSRSCESSSMSIDSELRRKEMSMMLSGLRLLPSSMRKRRCVIDWWLVFGRGGGCCVAGRFGSDVKMKSLDSF